MENERVWDEKLSDGYYGTKGCRTKGCTTAKVVGKGYSRSKHCEDKCLMDGGGAFLLYSDIH